MGFWLVGGYKTDRTALSLLLFVPRFLSLEHGVVHVDNLPASMTLTCLSGCRLGCLTVCVPPFAAAAAAARLRLLLSPLNCVFWQV